MAYFKINGHDYSNYVNQLKIGRQAIYKTVTTSNGNTVAKYLNTKRTFTVGIIPLNAAIMKQLQQDISAFQVRVSFLDPKTNTLVENVNCIIPNNDVEYYTIQADNVMLKAFTIVIQEL